MLKTWLGDEPEDMHTPQIQEQPSGKSVCKKNRSKGQVCYNNHNLCSVEKLITMSDGVADTSWEICKLADNT